MHLSDKSVARALNLMQLNLVVPSFNKTRRPEKSEASVPA